MSRPVTEREIELLQLAADGFSRSETAAWLCISEATVRSHFSTILLKLRVHSTYAAVAHAFGEGWIE